MSRVIPDEAWGGLTLYGEARGESFLGKVAVGEVIRARMARRLLSDGTLTGTIFKAKQFSCWNEGDPNRLFMAQVLDTDAAWQDCRLAWDESARSIATRAATHYLNVDLVVRLRGEVPTWAADPRNPRRVDERLVTLVEGRHTFLKLP